MNRDQNRDQNRDLIRIRRVVAGMLALLMMGGCGGRQKAPAESEATLVQTAPKALNLYGVVVGGLRPAVDALPAFVAIKGERQELKPPVGAAWALPQAINSRYQIVGYATEEAMQTRHACLWEPRKGAGGIYFEWSASRLPDGEAISSEAVAINDGGDTVGDFWSREGKSHPCLWRGGNCFELVANSLHRLDTDTERFQRGDGTPPITEKSRKKSREDSSVVWHPTGINAQGEIVGWGLQSSDKSDGWAHLYHFVPTQKLNQLVAKQGGGIGTLEGSLTDLGHGRHIAINDRGDMAADTDNPSGEVGACLWRQRRLGFLQSYERYFLPEPTGYRESHALALNNRGQVVGRYTAGNRADRTQQAHPGEPVPVLWEKGEAINLRTRLLTPFDGVLEEAIAINDAGQILCTGRQGIWGRGVLLSPVREPGVQEMPAPKKRRYRFQVF